MFWQIPTIQAFQSVVPGSIMEFYESVGVERSVASRPEADYYGLRSFLSCKYLFNYNGKFRNVVTKETKMPYWTYLNKQNNFDVYTNDCYIPYGFTYDEYITEKQYEQCSESNRHLLLLKAMVLTDEQAENMVIFLLRQRISISMNIPKKNIRRIARIEISLLAQIQSLIMVALLPTSQQRIVMSLYSLAYHTQRAGQHM